MILYISMHKNFVSTIMYINVYFYFAILYIANYSQLYLVCQRIKVFEFEFEFIMIMVNTVEVEGFVLKK